MMKLYDLFQRYASKPKGQYPHGEAFPHEHHANERSFILNFVKKGGVGAEFGVFRGHFSEIIVRVVEPTKLYLVDPWTKYGERFNWGDMPFTEFNKLTTLEAKEDTERRMQAHRGRVELIEDFEEEFCKSFQSTLDFVYLDSSHFYINTLRTLIMVDRILASDGVLIGDDWYWDTDHFSGVCRAVNDFVRCFDYEICYAGHKGQFCIRRTPEWTHEYHPERRPPFHDIRNWALEANGGQIPQSFMLT